jgi:hypothetical protein
MVIGIRLRMNDLPILTVLNKEDIIPSLVARSDGSVDRMMGTGLVVFQAFCLFLQVLHLPVSCHPFGMKLRGFFQFPVVGAWLESVLYSLGVDTVKDIANERGFLSDRDGFS